jgi:putative MATE family efflux protein
LRSLRDTFFGDRAFYRRVLLIVIPIIIQNLVANAVFLLDNVMIGRMGTLQISAVAIVNQLLFIFNLCVIAVLSSAGIFATQYAGAKNEAGARQCFRAKILMASALSAIFISIFWITPHSFIAPFLEDAESVAARAETMGYALSYMRWMLPGLFAFSISQAYAGALREQGETRLPMVASVISIFMNLCLNYLLIFGRMGLPRLGVVGAALATTISRFVELGIVVVAAHRRKERYRFLIGAYDTMHVNGLLWRSIAIKGFPLLANEFLWSTGVAMILKCYSTRGIAAVAACNITSSVNNLFNVVYISMGSAVAIMVGQELGANDIEKAKSIAWKLMATMFLATLVTGGIMLLLAPGILGIYNAEPEVKEIASALMRVLALCMPLYSVSHCCFFTLQSGGRTDITFLFDCVSTLALNLMCAWIIARFTNLPIVPMYACVEGVGQLKAVLGIFLVNKGIWARTIVAAEAGE